MKAQKFRNCVSTEFVKSGIHCTYAITFLFSIYTPLTLT